MDLAKVHMDFSTTLVRRGGGTIRGQIAGLKSPGEADAMSDRVLKVSPQSSAQAGDVVVTPTGVTYLLAQHHTAFDGAVVYKSFRMVHLDQVLTWSRVASTTDPVTGLARGEGEPVEIGPIPVAVEHVRLEGGDKIKAEAAVRITTGEDIITGDRVGDYEILFVEQTLGIKIAEAR